MHEHLSFVKLGSGFQLGILLAWQLLYSLSSRPAAEKQCIVMLHPCQCALDLNTRLLHQQQQQQLLKLSTSCDTCRPVFELEPEQGNLNHH